MVTVLTSSNNLKTKAGNLDVSKLKAVPVNLKKLSDLVANAVVKNTKFDKLKTKVNSLEKKILDPTTLIHINQYFADKQNLGKKLHDLDTKYQIRVL